MDGGPGNLRQFPVSYISKMMTKESYRDSHMNHLHVLDVNKKGCNKRKKRDVCWCISLYENKIQQYHISKSSDHTNNQIHKSHGKIWSNGHTWKMAKLFLELILYFSVVSYIGLSKISPRPSHWYKQRGRMRKEPWIKTLSGKPQLFWR